MVSTSPGRVSYVVAQVPPELREALAVRAAQEDRSLSAELRQAIREHLADDKEAA
jgi:plasmid stability protein